MKARSIKGASVEEISTALDQCMTGDFIPTIAFVFISVKQDRKAVAKIVQEKGIDLIGATSSGEFIGGYQEEGSIVMLLLDMPRDAYAIFYEDINGADLHEVSTQIAKNALGYFKNPAFILCSTGLSARGEFLNGGVLVSSIEAVIGAQVNIYGGMAGDDMSFTGTYVFTHGKETDNGIATLVIDEEKISLQGMAISGWKPIGISRTVTKSKDNCIYTIDDQPALEMYLKFLGKADQGEDKLGIFESIGIHYPFQVERETGAPVMRTPMSSSREENSVICDYDVPQGSKIRFSMPPDFDIVEKVLADAEELKKKDQSDAEALLIFSCAGRLSSLGPLVTAENDGLHEIWKAPMAGFFTYGEYGRAVNGRQEFHSTTCCWVALKEK